MKTELKSLILAGALCASTTTALAQGTVEFDWVGDDHEMAGTIHAKFQGSLTLDASLVYPNSVPWPGADQPWPPVPATGFNIAGPDGHLWPRDGGLTSELRTPSDFYSHFDSAGNLILYVYSGGDGISTPRLGIHDGGIFQQNDGVVYHQFGYWVQAPEPSAFALLGLGLLGLFMKKATSRS